MTRHRCQVCKDKLISNTLDVKRKLLRFLEAYDTDKSTFGGLHAPLCLFRLCHENVFVANFSAFSKSSCVGKNLLAKSENVAVSFQMRENFPLNYLRKLFLRMRIYYCLKCANRDFSSTKSKSKRKNKKLITLKITQSELFRVKVRIAEWSDMFW